MMIHNCIFYDKACRTVYFLKFITLITSLYIMKFLKSFIYELYNIDVSFIFLEHTCKGFSDSLDYCMS